MDRSVAQPERRRGLLREPSARASSGAARRDGVTSIVSSKVGPSGMSGLSKIAVTASAPSVSSPSMLSSQPGTNSSITIGSRSSLPIFGENAPDHPRGGEDPGAVVGTDHAAAAAQRHRLHHARKAQRAGGAGQRLIIGIRGQDTESGCEMPCAVHACRCNALSAAASTDATGLCASPSSAASRAARGSIWLSTATTELTWADRALKSLRAGAGIVGIHAHDRLSAERQRPVAADDDIEPEPWAALTKSVAR